MVSDCPYADLLVQMRALTVCNGLGSDSDVALFDHFRSCLNCRRHMQSRHDYGKPPPCHCRYGSAVFDRGELASG